MHSRLEVIASALECRMAELSHFEDNWSGTHINEFVGRILIGNLVSVRCAFFNEDLEAIHAVHEFVAVANVAFGCDNLSLSLALVALLLELLHKTRCDLLFLNSMPLALALLTSFHILGPVTA